YRAYDDHLNRSADDSRRLEVIGSIGEGMCVVDMLGRVTLWNDALERMIDCPRAQAIGHPIDEAVPATGDAQLRRVLGRARASHRERCGTLWRPAGGGPRVLDVKVLPVDGGLTLLWHDSTAHALAERAFRRNEERLMLAADGANDGWWEWDLRSHELYVSSR